MKRLKRVLSTYWGLLNQMVHPKPAPFLGLNKKFKFSLGLRLPFFARHREHLKLRRERRTRIKIKSQIIKPNVDFYDFVIFCLFVEREAELAAHEGDEEKN
jgi:hypothetical protein